MNDFKKIGISLLFIITILCTSLFLLTIFHYFGIIGGKTSAIFKVIFMLISLFIGGFINGQKSKENGWLEGLKLSSVLLLLWIGLGLILSVASFSFKHVLFYLIIVGITTFGSMIGINKKDTNHPS